MTATREQSGAKPSGAEPTEPVVSRPPRADAVRNRERVLTAAEQVFASEGISVPVDVVAERAGVGVGTLYRHFPTKEALLEAIVTNRMLEMAELAREYSSDPDPATALFTFLQRFAVEVADKHDLAESLQSAGIDIKARCSDVMEEMLATVDELIRRAAAVGAVRNDVNAEEIVGMVGGACHASISYGADRARISRVVEVICNGLRPVAGPPAG